MKNILIALVFLLTGVGVKPPDHLLINHIGISDKPIPSIDISTEAVKVSDNEQQFTYYHVVNKHDYDVIKNILSSAKFSNYQGNEFGSFMISVSKPQKKVYTLNHEESLRLFYTIIKALKTEHCNKSLLVDFEKVKKRVDFYTIKTS